MQLTYNCHFDLYRFPFDHQTCALDFKLLHRPITNFTFVEGEPVLYKGSNIFDQFSLDAMGHKLNREKKYTMYTLVVSFKRVPAMQLQKTFLPILFMGVLGYSTLFVDLDRQDVRFTGALTTMLVQGTWIEIISDDLPTTT